MNLPKNRIGKNCAPIKGASLLAKFCLSNFIKFYLINKIELRYSGWVVAKSTSGVRSPCNIGAQALFSAIFLSISLWQCVWESRKARRFLCYGTSNPAHTVAHFFEVNARGSLILHIGDCYV